MEPPDRLEKGIRFGCGFVFGCIIAFGELLTRAFAVGVHSAAVWSVIAGLFCGWAAVRFGDAFWRFMGRFGSWW